MAHARSSSGQWDRTRRAKSDVEGSFVIEGLLPFLNPQAWRNLFERATRLSDGQIRFFGLSSMLVGVLLLALWH